jgi:sigma-B regulation protein RsbU (phosphoserine phosphatase)
VDGLELCRRIRAARLDRYVYVILCTARNTKADLIEGIGAGADDFLPKPVDFAELNVRLRTATRILNLERDLADNNRKLSEANAEIEKDLKAAALVQTSLLPQGPCPVPGVRSAWVFLPSGLLAGDTFGYFPLGEGRLGFYQLDVSGHGAPAAMLSVTLSRALLPGEGSPVLREREGSRISAPHEVIAALNERFQDAGGRYFTILYGVLDAEARSLRFSQAGHPNPVHVRPSGRARFVGEGGFPAGMVAGMDYTSQDLAFPRGDRLLLYSDGLTECANPAGERFGPARLLDRAQATAQLDLDAAVGQIKSAVAEWRGGQTLEDDISLLALESV